MDDFFDFGDPFGPGSLMSIFLGGKDPFDDLFLTQPFGSLMGRTLGDDDGYEEKDGEEHEENTRKHSRPHKELVIQEADGIIEENKSRSIRYTNNFNHSHTMQSLSNTFTFQSSTMTYGDPNGAYFTPSMTRRMGGNGVIMEESKEPDTSISGSLSYKKTEFR